MKKIFILLFYVVMINFAFSKERTLCKEELCIKVLNYREEYYDEEKSIEDLIKYFVPELNQIYQKEKSYRFRFFSTDVRLPIDVPVLVEDLHSLDFFECKDISFGLLEISPYFNLPKQCLKLVGTHRAYKPINHSSKRVVTKLVFFQLHDDWKIGLIENTFNGNTFGQAITIDE